MDNNTNNNNSESQEFFLLMENQMIRDGSGSHLEYVNECELEYQIQAIKQYAEKLLDSSLTKDVSSRIINAIYQFENSRSKLWMETTGDGNILYTHKENPDVENLKCLKQKIIETMKEHSDNLSCLLRDGFKREDWKTISIESEDVNLQVKISKIYWDITLFDKSNKKRKRSYVEKKKQSQMKGPSNGKKTEMARNDRYDENEDSSTESECDRAENGYVDKQQQPRKKSRSTISMLRPSSNSLMLKPTAKNTGTDTKDSYDEQQQQQKTTNSACFPLFSSSSSLSVLSDDEFVCDSEEQQEKRNEITEEESMMSPEYDTVPDSIQKTVSSLDAGQLMKEFDHPALNKRGPNCNFSQPFMMRSYTCHSCDQHRERIIFSGHKINECRNCWRITCTKCMKERSIRVGTEGCSVCLGICTCKKCTSTTQKKAPPRCIIENPVRKSWFEDDGPTEFKNIHIVFFTDRREWNTNIMERNPTEGLTINDLKNFLSKESDATKPPVLFDLEGKYAFVCRMSDFKKHSKCFEGHIRGSFKITSKGKPMVTVRYQAFKDGNIINGKTTKSKRKHRL